jgi:hypothetical protein
MPETIRLTPGRTNVSRAEFLVTLRAMHTAKWGRRRVVPLSAVALADPAPEPAEAEERRLTPDEVADVERLRRESASHWTWKRLGQRYGTTGYAVKLSVLGMERR